MVERALAADRLVAEIQSVPSSGTVAAAFAELFATVAETVAVADVEVDARLVDETTDETVDEEAGAWGAAVDGVTGAVTGAEGATSGGVSDERDIRREPAPVERSYRSVTSVVDRYLVDTSASRPRACSSADRFARKCCRRSRRKC